MDVSEFTMPLCRCGATAVRLIAAVAYCAQCADAILDPIRDRVGTVDGLVGRAVRRGADALKFGPSAFHAACDRCEATWVALVEHEPCRWCQARHRLIAVEQAALTLRAPEVDEADRRHPEAMRAWAERLKRAIEAGIVTLEQADAAWRREVATRAAA